MKRKQKDRHLDMPSEANRDKHINFLALENNDEDPADIPATGKLADQEESKKFTEKRNEKEKKTGKK